MHLPDLSALSREVGSRHIALTDTPFDALDGDSLAHLMRGSLLLFDNPANGPITPGVGSAQTLRYLRQLCEQFHTYQLTHRSVAAAGESLLLPLLEIVDRMQIDPIETAKRRTVPQEEGALPQDETSAVYYSRILKLVNQRCAFVSAMGSTNEELDSRDLQHIDTVRYAASLALQELDVAVSIDEKVARALWFCKRGEPDTIQSAMQALIENDQDLASTNATVNTLNPNAAGPVMDTALGHIIRCNAAVPLARRIDDAMKSTLIRNAAEFVRPSALIRLIAAFPRTLSSEDAAFALKGAVDKDSHPVMGALLSTDAHGEACVLQPGTSDSLRVHAVDMQKALAEVAFTESKAQILYQPFSGTDPFDYLERTELDRLRVERLKQMILDESTPAAIAPLADIPNYPLNDVLFHELIDAMLGDKAPSTREALVPLAILLANLATNDAQTLLAVSEIPEFHAWRTELPGPYPRLLPPNT